MFCFSLLLKKKKVFFVCFFLKLYQDFSSSAEYAAGKDRRKIYLLANPGIIDAVTIFSVYFHSADCFSFISQSK